MQGEKPKILKNWTQLHTAKIDNYSWTVWEKDQRYQWTINDSVHYWYCFTVQPRRLEDEGPMARPQWEHPDKHHVEFPSLGRLIQNVDESSKTPSSFSEDKYLDFARSVREALT
jgi:hypothetical protein